MQILVKINTCHIGAFTCNWVKRVLYKHFWRWISGKVPLDSVPAADG